MKGKKLKNLTGVYIENFKKRRGITLVALVITIIILLILAGITIAQLTGSGLFENARLAEQKSEEAKGKEDIRLSDYANVLEEYISNNREKANFTELYGNISTTGTYTLKDSIEKYDKILFITGNLTTKACHREFEFYTNFIKQYYNETADQFQISVYDSMIICFYMKDSQNITFNRFKDIDENTQILGIYGVN